MPLPQNSSSRSPKALQTMSDENDRRHGGNQLTHRVFRPQPPLVKWVNSYRPFGPLPPALLSLACVFPASRAARPCSKRVMNKGTVLSGTIRPIGPQLLVALVAFIYCVPSEAQGATKTWDAGGNAGDASDERNWNSSALPGPSDDVLFDNSGQSPVEDIFLNGAGTKSAEMLLADISGQSPRPRLRAPFGERNERVLRIAATLGYRSIYWTIDSLDSVEPRKTPEFLIDRITSKTDAELDGAIILMHVGIKSTAEALPAIIANLQGRGFRLVTVSTLLAADPKRP